MKFDLNINTILVGIVTILLTIIGYCAKFEFEKINRNLEGLPKLEAQVIHSADRLDEDDRQISRLWKYKQPIARVPHNEGNED